MCIPNTVLWDLSTEEFDSYSHGDKEGEGKWNIQKRKCRQDQRERTQRGNMCLCEQDQASAAEIKVKTAWGLSKSSLKRQVFFIKEAWRAVPET